MSYARLSAANTIPNIQKNATSIGSAASSSSNKRHPREKGKTEIEAFLTSLAVEEKVAASNQNQVLNAIVFLLNMVLQQPVDFPLVNVHAKRPKRFPAVLTRPEVQRLIGAMSGK